MIEVFQPYTSSLIALAILVLMVLAQSFHSTFVNLVKGKGTAGMPVEGSPVDQHWRIFRVHQNSVENFSTFAAAVFCAILVGASAGWVATFAWIHVLARAAHWVVYVKGIGTTDPGPRTITFVVGFFANVFIALLAVFAGLF